MLLLDRRGRLRRRTIHALAASPRVFATMLSVHVGAVSMVDLAGAGLTLGWRMLTV
jgi:hypothetical protein